MSLLRDFYIGTRAIRKSSGKGWLSSFWSLVIKNRRRYGGFVVHIGIVFIVLGLASYGYYQYKENFALKEGQEFTVKNYRLKYVRLTSFEKRNYEGVGSLIEVYNSGKFKGIIRPEKRFYKNQEPTTEVAILSNIFEDLYLILDGWNNDDSIALTVVINPLLSWIWVGTGVVVFGTIWAVLPKRKRDDELDIIEKDIILHLKGIETK
jgi:cytochrome c-type biogenesis protein CcmF